MILRASVLWLTLMAAIPAAAQAPSTAPPVVAPAAPADPIFTDCMSSLRGIAEKQGITTASFDTYTNDLAADM